MVYGHPSTDIHTNVYANTVNTRDRGPECTAALPERIRHAGGTVGDRGARPGRIPAAARAHNPARGLQQLQGPSRSRRARVQCARTSARAAGWPAAARAGAAATQLVRAVERRPPAPAWATPLAPAHVYNRCSRCQHVCGQAGGRGSRLGTRTGKLAEAVRSVESSRPEGQTHGDSNPTCHQCDTGGMDPCPRSSRKPQQPPYG